MLTLAAVAGVFFYQIADEMQSKAVKYFVDPAYYHDILCLIIYVSMKRKQLFWLSMFLTLGLLFVVSFISFWPSNTPISTGKLRDGAKVFFPASQKLDKPDKITGVNLVSPPRRPDKNPMGSLESANAGWVSIIPYAFSRAGQPQVTANSPRQWWGERTEGARQLALFAREENLKIMFKPHIWVGGQGWAGDYKLETEEDWQIWEKEFDNYVLPLAELAEELKVEIFCIATEYRQIVRLRPAYWDGLIAKIRKIYSGKLTYAANWDNIEHVSFWGDLDYIGIDAYFPLLKEANPSVKDMVEAWKVHKQQVEKLRSKYNKPILFTEYGYCSVDFAAHEPWKVGSRGDAAVNFEAQDNAYEALFQSFWNEEWFAGGFLWKWHINPEARWNRIEKAFSPQNKPAMNTIRKWYGDNG